MKPVEELKEVNIASEGPVAYCYELVYQPGYFVIRCANALNEGLEFEGMGETPEEAISEARDAALAGGEG